MGKPSPWASRDPGGEGRAVPERRWRPQSTWAAGPTGRTEPGGGVGKRTLIGRGEAPGQSASAAKRPTAKPSAWPPRCPREPSASEAVALMGRLIPGTFGNIGRGCHQRVRCCGGRQGRLHTLGGTGAYGPGCPDAMDKVEGALYTLHPGSQGSPGLGRPSRPCAQSLPQAPPGGPPLPC